MPVTANRPGPYAPGSAILGIVNRYRNHGLPTPINNDVLARAGIPESLIPRTLQALQTLDLINEDGSASPVLDGLRRAPEAEFRPRMAAWIRGAYAEVFAFVDPEKDDDTRIRDAFRGYEPAGQQARMITLFQALITAAGIRPDKPATARPTRKFRVRLNDPQPTIRRASSLQQPSRRSSESIAPTLPAPVAGLMTSLPAEGDGWTKETRDKFLTTFAAILDFCFPIVKHANVGKENGDQD